MPQKIQLDDSDYNLIYNRALEKLEKNAPWWTHKEAADPGVTLLEIFGLVADMQSRYMDMVQESHYRKYLKLLGESPDSGQPAGAWVSMENVEEDTKLPEGTKLLADHMVFETVKEETLRANSICAVYQGMMESKIYERLICGTDRIRKNSFSLEAGNTAGAVLFTLLLERALPEQGCIALHITLDERRNRNPVGDKAFRIAETVWEYETDYGWRQAEEIEDTTWGLLYTGCVELRIGEGMTEKNGNARLRCILRGRNYDIPPVLYKIQLNVVRVAQTDTLCRTSYLSFEGGEEWIVPLSHYLELTGNVDIYGKTKDGLWETFTSYCGITEALTAGNRNRFLIFSRQKYGRMPASGKDTVKIVSRHQSFIEEFTPISVTGGPAQMIPLPWKSIYRPSLEMQLLSGTGSGLNKEYRCTEAEDDRFMNAWHWDDREGMPVLGDGRHGDIPPEAQAGVCITSLVLTEGERGNTAYGRIQRPEKPELFGGITCRNYSMAKGGRNLRSAKERFESLDLANSTLRRAVTAADYEELASKTPGLVIETVTADLTESGTVLLDVRVPEGMTEECRALYRYVLIRHLEEYRMVTTQVSVKLTSEGRD